MKRLFALVLAGLLVTACACNNSGAQSIAPDTVPSLNRTVLPVPEPHVSANHRA